MEEQLANEPKKEVKKNPSRLILLSALAVVLLLVLFVVVYAQKYNQVQTDVAPTSTSSPAISATTTTERIVDQGVRWVNPIKLDDLGLFVKNTSGDTDSYGGTVYYKVGELEDEGEVILAHVSMNWPTTIGGGNVFRFIHRGDEYTLLMKNSDRYSSEYYSLAKNVSMDDEYVFASLLPDNIIIKEGTKLVKTTGWQVYLADETNELIKDRQKKTVAQTSWGSLDLTTYKQIDEGSVSNVATYTIKLNDSSEVTYKSVPSFLRDDSTLNMSWKVESAQNNTYSQVSSGGCGLGVGGFPVITDSSAISGMEVAASNASGQEILYSSDKSSKINEYGYEMYQMGREGSQIKPIDDFVSDVGIIVWKDAYGQNIAYLNTEYAALVECGKPVVYLYPKSETAFEVKVGADVTVSEPSYGSGWSGVAKPSGQLIVNGREYSNLFWEGLGWGMYPRINSGTVVAAKDAEATIKSQLKYMSLNDQEIADFMEFWSPKLPKSNYVRISWIYGKQMDQLAPLYVSPKPESVIRVFMDFAALSAPVEIKKQELPKFERKGFTVVEWGGLLVK